jgi:hypothetical protein
MDRATSSLTRNTLIPLALALVAIALIVPLNAVAGPTSATRTLRVAGSGVRAPEKKGEVPFPFSFHATTAPRHSVNGTFSGHFPHDPAFKASGRFATFSGVVTCLQVKDHAATIGGVFTHGYGYDDNFKQQRDLTGDWFITTVHDPKGHAHDTMGFIDWGDRAYFAAQGFHTFNSLCDNPTKDVGKSQFPLSSGDITISGK